MLCYIGLAVYISLNIGYQNSYISAILCVCVFHMTISCDPLLQIMVRCSAGDLVVTGDWVRDT